MKKRGQVQGEFFRYFLIIFIAVVIVILGFKVISRIRSTSCVTSTELFKDELRKSIEAMHGDLGSISEEDLNVPCDVDKIYFVDLDKDISSLNKSLKEYPLLRNAIESNVDKNVFFVKNEKVVDSFYVGDIELQKPYFVCTDTGKGDVGLYLGGRGTSTEIVNKECVFDCTFEVVEVDYDTAKEIMEEAKKGECKGCPEGDLDDELKLYNETKKFVKIARRCNCGRKPGEAVVEILIKPEGAIKQFSLIERIPKDYVDDLYDYEPIVKGGDNVKVIHDPLIMWHFNLLDEETIVSYTLDTDVFEYCADVLETIGYGIPDLSNELDYTDEELKDIEEKLKAIEKDDPLEFELPDEYIEIEKGKGNNNVFKKPVWHFVSDMDIASRNIFRGYIYNMSIDGINYEPVGRDAFYGGPTYNPSVISSQQDFVSCGIEQNSGRVECEVGLDFNLASHEFYIKVTDSQGDFSVDKFTVKVKGLADCSGNTNEIACVNLVNLGCEWCLECDGMRYSGGSNRCVNAGECPYTCDTAHCNADCDSVTKCWDGCYGGKNAYECGEGKGCGDDCECLGLPSDPITEGCSLVDDKDSDEYHGSCDCLDDPINLISVNVNPGSNNPYCDCNSLTGGGVVGGIEEKGDLCFDGYDNNCNGITDGCSKLRCRRERYTGCQYNCQAGDCALEFGAGWQDTGDYLGWPSCGWFSLERKCKCRYDWETECTENPVCIGGSVLETINCFATCTDNDGDDYSIEGGTCGEKDCNDNNINIKPGATEVCSDNVDNDCDGDKDCGDEDCNSFYGCQPCELTSAYWSTDKAEEGDVVKLTVKSTNGCYGRTVNFKVWEDDWMDDDYMPPDPESHSFGWDDSGCIAETTWIAKYVSDYETPEYYFRATVPDGNKNIISKNNGGGNPEILEVTEVCPDNDNDGYTDEGCGGDDCNDNDGSIKPGVNDICDSKDNNCDGSIDEGLGSTTCGEGECEITVQNCVGGITQTCVPGAPSTEICDDNKDNDCDGVVDNCVVLPCQLTSAYWEGDSLGPTYFWTGSSRVMASVRDGSEVDLIVNGAIGCDGKTVNFKVWEYDLYSQDNWYYPGQNSYISPDPDSSNSWSCDDSGCIAKTEWEAVWIEDSGLDYGDAGYNPEYFFKASVTGNQIESSGWSSYNTGKVEYIRVVKVAELSAGYSNLRKNVAPNPGVPSGSDWYYYDLTIVETNGVGVTLSYRRRCWLNGNCEGLKYDPIAKFGTNRVYPHDEVTADNRWFGTNIHPNRMTETWYGTDDNGNDVEVSYSIDTS